MKTLKTVLSLGAVLLAAPVIGQNVVLKFESDANLTALLSAHQDMQEISMSFEPLSTTMSPDSAILQSLSSTASAAQSSLRAVTDLLGVYDNMQDARDRAMMKPLLDDRLRLYSRLLGLDSQSASLPLTTPGAVKAQATNQRALQLRDALRAAKAKVDAAVASLN
jgi:hypothetical protein